MIKVYHKPDGMFETFKHAGNVDTTNLDVAFEQTNHIDRPWHKNDMVMASYGVPNRSTSVGDLFVDTEDGGVYEVAPQGFNRLNPAEYPQARAELFMSSEDGHEVVEDGAGNKVMRFKEEINNDDNN